MRDAASAAAMSDPDRNRWFNRRWVDLPIDGALHQPAETPRFEDDLAMTGIALLQEWRRRRDGPAAWPG